MHRPARALAIAAFALLVLAAPAAAAPCDPFTAPQFGGHVPTPKSILGFDLGKKEVTTAQSDAYLGAVDGASDRVVTGSLARTIQGRDLRYAIVGHPDRVTDAGLATIRANAAKLMDPDTPPAEAAAIAAADPAILWIAGNVHGTEESGADAALRTVYELADREDCAARQILDAAIVVVLPIQNPDGREADTRRNAYGFDMNRDWFARTQPETDGKVEALRSYPPVLFIDAHEMGNTAGYFFPPNADPIYHEIADSAVDWINGLYGPAMQKAFDDRKIPYFNYSTYDLFYAGYGDTVPANGFGAAGMTFEKTDSDPVQKRVSEQFLTQWTTLSTAATHKADILNGWHGSWVEARQEGIDGKLEPNHVVQPDNEIQQQVPDKTVRQYFLRADDPDKTREVQALVRRLQRMDVEVRRLTADAVVADFTPYGRATRSETLPAGTYVVSMAQRQKHWVQSMLNEDTYVPFPYFYDVTAWSGPLLYDVAGGYSAAPLAAATTVVPAAGDPGYPALPATLPKVAVFSMSPMFGRGMESAGWLHWVLDQWKLPYTDLTAKDIAAGKLAGKDVLLVPDGYAVRDPSVKGDPYGIKDLGPAGMAAIKSWVQGGGRYVGWLDGALLAAAAGVSSATFDDAEGLGISSPGALIRAQVSGASPLGAGVGPFAYAFWDSRYVMRSHGAPTPMTFPSAGSEDFFVSGYADGAAALGDSAAIVDEKVGNGRTVAFGFEPAFRAFTDGTQKILRNAILGPDPAVAGIARLRDHSNAGTRAKARRAARRMRSHGNAVQLVVVRRDAARTRALLRRAGRPARVVRGGGRTTFLLRNRRDASGDENRWARGLELKLRRAGVRVVMYRVP